MILYKKNGIDEINLAGIWFLKFISSSGGSERVI